jgi:hypothetical protein
LSPRDRSDDIFCVIFIVNNGYAVPRDNLTQGHSVTATWQATDNLTVKNVFAYRTAKVLGITIPPAIMVRADRVIQ